MSSEYAINISSVEAAHRRVKPFIHITPVLTSRTLDDLVGAKIFFKAENFQKTGSFKFRGATNAILKGMRYKV
jgi:threonine dehydratase